MPAPRQRGLSVRLRLALSYCGFLVIAGTLLLAVVSVFLLRYVPDTVDVHPNRSDLTKAFAPAATLVMIVLLVIGLAGGWFLAGRMLAPLSLLHEAARQASAGTLSHRMNMRGRADEFRDLADVFDAMLSQLEAQVESQKRFAANASHELRTPLAITQALLDVAEADPHRDADALITRLRRVTGRAVDLTEALLLLHRAGNRTFARTGVDVSLLAEEATEQLLPLAEARGVQLEVSAETARTRGEPALLQQLTTNLVHNAIVHNLASGGVVRVHTRGGATGPVFRVENTGPEIAPGLPATLRDPFQRASERSRQDRDHVGAGLGLAIVEAIAQSHDARLEVTPRQGGGLIVTVTFAPGTGAGQPGSRLRL